MDQEHLARIKSELDVIEAWDETYHRGKTHSEMDEVAYRIRQARRREIVREITSLGGSVTFLNRGPENLVKKRRQFVDSFSPSDA